QIASNQETEQIIIRLHDLGFGPKLAMAIYQVYLGDTLNVVENKPYQLVYDVKGIGFNKDDTLARNVGIQFNDNERLKDVTCYVFYIVDNLNVVKNKPYQLVYDVKGIGFNKADTLARNVGIQFNDNERLKAGLLYVLEEECIKQGHTYLPTQNVLEMTHDMLS